MNDMSKAETARRLVLQSIEPGAVRDEILECVLSMDIELARLRAIEAKARAYSHAFYWQPHSLEEIHVCNELLACFPEHKP